MYDGILTKYLNANVSPQQPTMLRRFERREAQPVAPPKDQAIETLGEF